METIERYNSATNRFCCDDCYIRIGMPSSPCEWTTSTCPHKH